MAIDEARGAGGGAVLDVGSGQGCHMAAWQILPCFQTGAASDPAQGCPLLL